jgi:hypothetical protein
MPHQRLFSNLNDFVLNCLGLNNSGNRLGCSRRLDPSSFPRFCSHPGKLVDRKPPQQHQYALLRTENHRGLFQPGEI